MNSLPWALLALSLAQNGAQEPEELPPETPETASSPTAHRHLGFLFRGELGGGYARVNEPYNGSPRSFERFGARFAASIGGALGENEILAFHLSGLLAADQNSPPPPNSAPYSLVGLGPEFTHYFMPLNLFLSGALLLTRAEMSNGYQQPFGPYVETVDIASDFGPGLEAAIGKEWWIAEHWGIGFLLEYEASWNHDAAGILGGGTLFTSAFTLSFCATYN